MTPAQIETFFATLQAINPLPASELEYTSVFELLAAVLLSAQATDVGVNKATRRLFPVANTPQQIIDLGLERLEAFGEPTMAVDTHIFRVSNRTGLAPGKTPLEVELKLLKRVPEKYLPHAHHWLILHGRYVCVARTPRCWECAVARCCDYQPKTPAP